MGNYCPKLEKADLSQVPSQSLCPETVTNPIEAVSDSDKVVI